MLIPVHATYSPRSEASSPRCRQLYAALPGMSCCSAWSSFLVRDSVALLLVWDDIVDYSPCASKRPIPEEHHASRVMMRRTFNADSAKNTSGNKNEEAVQCMESFVSA
eukprot:1185299-Prorocentrum_minimum.AAC.4